MHLIFFFLTIIKDTQNAEKKLMEIKCLSAYYTTKCYHILTVYPMPNTAFDHLRLHNPVKYFFFFNLHFTREEIVVERG